MVEVFASMLYFIYCYKLPLAWQRFYEIIFLKSLVYEKKP